MKIYINYPNPHITIHKDATCEFTHMHQPEEQRRLSVGPDNQDSILCGFIARRYVFKAEKRLNGLWLDVSLENSEQEEAFAERIHAILGQTYKHLRHAQMKTHCG